jgi:3-dehydroquinate synthase
VTTSTASYPVVVAAGGLASLPERLAALGLRGTLWLVSDAAVQAAYGEPLLARLRDAGYAVQSYIVPAGEQSKGPAQLAALYDWLIGGGVERRDALLALGGGVVGDLAGFVAATVLRGIAVVQLPTTLQAMVDAAVGGKTGINHTLGKNLIGAFHQPRLVLADTDTLASLPPRELRAGWAEVIKHGVIRDVGLFERLEDERRKTKDEGGSVSAEIIRRAVAVKVAVVSADEFEQGERIILNYGHTIGHALENALGYGELLHGEAVAIGMHVEARISQAMGLCDAPFIARQQALIEAYGLSTSVPAGLDLDHVLALTLRDKKVQAKRVRWVLPIVLGQVAVRDDVPEALVRKALHP